MPAAACRSVSQRPAAGHSAAAGWRASQPAAAQPAGACSSACRPGFPVQGLLGGRVLALASLRTCRLAVPAPAPGVSLDLPPLTPPPPPLAPSLLGTVRRASCACGVRRVGAGGASAVAGCVHLARTPPALRVLPSCSVLVPPRLRVTSVLCLPATPTRAPSPHTPQEKYAEQGLVIQAFPCNQVRAAATHPPSPCHPKAPCVASMGLHSATLCLRCADQPSPPQS